MQRPDLKSVKNKDVLEYINYLEKQLETPYFTSYISIKKIINDGNDQIGKVKLDILSPEGEGQFKLITKFASSLSDLFEQMEKLKAKMTPDEALRLEKIVSKPEGVEEYLKSKS